MAIDSAVDIPLDEIKKDLRRLQMRVGAVELAAHYASMDAPTTPGEIEKLRNEIEQYGENAALADQRIIELNTEVMQYREENNRLRANLGGKHAEAERYQEAASAAEAEVNRLRAVVDDLELERQEHCCWLLRDDERAYPLSQARQDLWKAHKNLRAEVVSLGEKLAVSERLRLEAKVEADRLLRQHGEETERKLVAAELGRFRAETFWQRYVRVNNALQQQILTLRKRRTDVVEHRDAVEKALRQTIADLEARQKAQAEHRGILVEALKTIRDEARPDIPEKTRWWTILKSKALALQALEAVGEDRHGGGERDS